MKIKEITNAQDKLDLLRVIIDNTWSAIRKEAEVEAQKRAAKPLKAKSQVVRTPKRLPYVPPPKVLPKPPQQLAKSKQALPKPTIARTPDEIRAYQDYLKSEKVRTALPTQNQGLSNE